MSGIVSLATAVPEHEVPQDLAAAHAISRCCETSAQRELLARIYANSGVRSRQSVLPVGASNDTEPDRLFFPPGVNGTTAGPTTAQRMQQYERSAAALAERAARDAIDQSSLDAAHITHLITCSCTGFRAPGIDVDLIRSLNLLPGIERTHIGFMGCHAAINAMRIARAITLADPHAAVLLCAVELCSLHFAYGYSTQRIIANALFADGAASAIIAGHAHARHTETPSISILDTASHLLPDSAQEMTWTIGDHGFEMTLSPRVPRLIETHLESWLASFLARHDLTIDDIGGWAIHPGGPRILESVARALALNDDQLAPSNSILARYGNMSSPTVLFIVDELDRTTPRRPILALAFGPGLTAEAALLG